MESNDASSGGNFHRMNARKRKKNELPSRDVQQKCKLLVIKLVIGLN